MIEAPLSKEEITAHLAEVSARMELATDAAAFALGLLTAEFLRTGRPVAEETLDAAFHVQSIKDGVELWRLARA